MVVYILMAEKRGHGPSRVIGCCPHIKISTEHVFSVLQFHDNKLITVRLHSKNKADESKAMPVFSYKIQNFKKKFRHLYGDLNLDKIKKHIVTAVCKWRDESNEPN